MRRTLRASLILFFTLFFALAFFFHFRQTHLASFAEGQRASRYLMAEVDFDFTDEEATNLLKQEAARDLGPIYKIDEKEIAERRADFESMLIYNPNWRSLLVSTTFDQLYLGSEALSSLLSEARFMGQITLDTMKQLQVLVEGAYVYQPLDGELSVLLPKQFWQRAEQLVLLKLGQDTQAANFLLNFFQNAMWTLQEDYSLGRQVRKALQESIASHRAHVKEGAIIIQKGEIVSERHLAMIVAMKSALGETRNYWDLHTIVGSALLAAVFAATALWYLRAFKPELLGSTRQLLLLLTIVLSSLAIAKAAEYFLLHHPSHLVDIVRFPLFLPLTCILVSTLLGSDIVLFVASFVLIALGLELATDVPRFLAVNFIGGLVAILSCRNMHKRKQVFVSCALVWLSCIPLIFGFYWFTQESGAFTLMTDLASTAIFMVATAIVAVGALPLLESLFHVLTDMALMEYMDPGNDLLRRLSVEAPGTYQHCLVVGNLAETAARAIGARALFCRVATLYHDVGKLCNPHYFTENQLGGFNIHQLLTPQESTQVIIAHVTEGEALARKHRLPESFIDVIREHHGTSLVYYFFSKQVELLHGDVMKVDEKLFRYPGPKPKSKESTIIMLADTVEAASRSLEEPTEQAIVDMIDRLVAEKADDGQLDECTLSFEELGVVKRALAKTLNIAHHLRVKYPERKSLQTASI